MAFSIVLQFSCASSSDSFAGKASALKKLLESLSVLLKASIAWLSFDIPVALLAAAMA